MHHLENELNYSKISIANVEGAFIATDLANDFQLTNVDQKLVYLNFWRTWAPFAHEAPRT